jgi:mannose-6-phosphate isomerase-like protein (cupin superfamily)
LADYTIKRVEEIEAIADGGFRRARAALGVSSFGMQILELPPNFADYGEHDHSGSGQEEVYVVLRGSGEIEVEGERIALDAETLIRVGPQARRKIYAGEQGMCVLALGGTPGKPYEPPSSTQLGAPDLGRELPNSTLRTLLLDPAFPAEKLKGSRQIALDDFYRFARERLGFGDLPGVEERLDQFVTHIGGRLVPGEGEGPIFEVPEEAFSGENSTP